MSAATLHPYRVSTRMAAVNRNKLDRRRIGHTKCTRAGSRATIKAKENIDLNASGKRTNSTTRAFTLIELLIVVAIIAILAAIAIPNLLDAQARAKVARAKADVRSISVALEAYAVDYSVYPFFDPDYEHSYLLDVPELTTPIAYLASLPNEVFLPPHRNSERQRYYRYYPVDYWARFFPEVRAMQWTWVLMSNAPDLDIDVDEEGAADVLRGGYSDIYDPTNGTVSDGDIWVTNKGIIGQS